MALKIWNWQSDEWPNFSYDQEALKVLELQFSKNIGTVSGAFKYISNPEKELLVVELLSSEALKTSEIEGEYLDRDSIQSSIKKNLGLSVDKRKVPPAEFGISELMVDLYRNYHRALSHGQLFEWHRMLTNGRRDLIDIGAYRTHEDAMQVVSGRLDRPTVHFEAPPSRKIPNEMEQFIVWFNTFHLERPNALLPIVKAGISHLYFVSIHPFEDGNGRISRALSEKSISLSVGQPALLSLSKTIGAHKKVYYEALERNNKTCNITDWLLYFGETILDAQKDTLGLIDFIIKKGKFFDSYSNRLNERQLKVVNRLFAEGPQGFTGGLSAENYTRIAKTSASTATRDLKDMVDKKVLIKTGILKSTRYQLNLR